MKEIHYFVKVGKDGVSRIFKKEVEVKVISVRQAKKEDIRQALDMHTSMRMRLDDALQEYIK